MSGHFADWPWTESDRSVQGLQEAIRRGHYPRGRYGHIRLEPDQPAWILPGWTVISTVAGRLQWAWVPDRGDQRELFRAELEGHDGRVEACVARRPDPGVELDRAVTRHDGTTGMLLLLVGSESPTGTEPGA